MTVDAGSPVREQVQFGTLAIAYDDRVLRPRAWTTAQSTWAADLLRAAPAGPVLELCAGAGQIGLLAVADSDRDLVCVDANPVACAFTEENAAAAGMAGRVETRNGDLAAMLGDDERFVLVVADPPWVPAADIHQFPEDPVLAIDGGTDGLAVAVLCLDVAGQHLRRGGSLLLQLGTEQQVDALAATAAARNGFTLVETRTYERGVVARFDLV